MNAQIVVAEVDPELLEVDGDEDDEWEDVEVEEIYPALANLELGEQIVHYQPYQEGMLSATKYLRRQVSLIMGTLVMAAISTTAICKEDPSPYPSCLEGFQQTPVQFFSTTKFKRAGSPLWAYSSQ
ncbi:hypothetical protein MRX96_054827 [Rhipicephalus microplus]